MSGNADMISEVHDRLLCTGKGQSCLYAHLLGRQATAKSDRRNGDVKGRPAQLVPGEAFPGVERRRLQKVALATPLTRRLDEPLNRRIKLLLTRRRDQCAAGLVNDDVTVCAGVRSPLT